MNASEKAILNLFIVLLLLNNTAFSQQKEEDALPINSNVKEIIVICKTHFDIGYTHRVKDLIPYYRTTMIDKALDVMDQTNSLPKEQQFTWTAPGWVVAKVLEDWDGQTPERRQRIEEALKSGRIVTHAVPFTLESESVFPECIARGFDFSKSVCEKYNLPLPRGAKMTDVPSQGSILATVLAQGDVKFLHLGCNWPSGYVRFPALFWWEGPDGSRILTLYSHTYGTTVGLLTPDDWTNHFPRDRSIGKDLIPPSDWPYSVWPAIMVTPDNSGPPTADKITSMFDEAKKLLPGVNIRVGTFDDFANAILATHPNIPVVKKEAPDTWIHGYGCDPGGMKLCRNIQPLIPAAEVLNTQLSHWGIATVNVSEDIAKAYENCLLYVEHTWGGAASVNEYGDKFKNLSPEEYKDLEGSWEDKTDYIRTSDQIIRKLLKNNMNALAANVKCNGKRLVVYNPLPWNRTEWVCVPDEDLHFLAKDIPACGYKTFTWDEVKNSANIKSSPNQNVNTIENEYYKLVFDPVKGGISSFIDKRTGRDWADNYSETGLGQYMNERFTYEQTLEYTTQYQQGRAVNSFGTNGDWPHPGMYKPGMISAKEVPYRSATSRNGSLKITNMAHCQIMSIEFPSDTANHLPATMLTITLKNGMPYVDMEMTIKEKEKDNWPQSDWFCFPFKLTQPTFTIGRTLGVMDPLSDIMYGANRDIYAVGAGVCMTDIDGSGVTVCPIDHPLVSLDRPGIWKFSLDFIPQKPVVYINLFNNQWNTNFRYWYAGTWSSRVRVWTFDKSSTPANALQIPSFEARTPLFVAKGNGKGGTLPLSQNGIALSRSGIEVTAFKPGNNNQILLRVWEQAGIPGNVTVQLPPGIKASSAQPVNLRGEVQGNPVKVENGKFSFSLRGYAPASFVLSE
jgi:alpha-mannosidase